MSFTVIGLSHHHAPIGVRELFHRSPHQCDELLKKWHDQMPQNSFILLSTCNRLELYTDLSPRHAFFEICVQDLAFSNNIFFEHSYTLEGSECVLHLFKVACGLDSKIIGENQIISQLKQSFQLSKGNNCLKHQAQRLFEKSFYWAKKFKSQQQLSKLSTRSWGAIAAQFINTSYRDLSTPRSLLFIGAGQTIEHCLNHYEKLPEDRLTLCNRSTDNLLKLRHSSDSELCLLEDLSEKLKMKHFDIIVIATASQTPLIWANQLAACAGETIIIDLSVPRNTDPKISMLPDKKVYLLDDLPMSYDFSTPHTWEQLDQAAQEFLCWLKTDSQREYIKKQREKMLKAQNQLLEKAIKKLNHGQLPQEVLKIFGHQLMQKLLHQYPVTEKQNMIE